MLRAGVHVARPLPGICLDTTMYLWCSAVGYLRRRTRRRQRGERMGTSQRGPAFFRPLDSNQPMLPQAWIPAGAGLELALGPTRGAGAGSPTRADSALPAGAISRGPNNVDIDGSGTAKERKHQGGMEVRLLMRLT